jgi:hypothetical protein
MGLRERIKPLTVTLWVLSVASILLALVTSDEPVPEVFKNTWVEVWFEKLPTGNAILFDISIGFLVSVLFYLLVVWFPDRRKKNLIKNNLAEHYRSFKEDTIGILLAACQGSYQADLPEKLSEQSEFRKYFKEPVSDSQERWHAVLNGLNDRLLTDLLVELEILLNEVTYVLNNVNIENPDVFSFFKRLSQAVYKLKTTTLEYDDVKTLSRFLWEVFAGWNFVDGYREDDIVGVMIEKI